MKQDCYSSSLYFVDMFRVDAYRAALAFTDENPGTYISGKFINAISASHLSERDRIIFNLSPDDVLDSFVVFDSLTEEIEAYFAFVEWSELSFDCYSAF